jgi:hypothetical protein
LHVTVRVEQPVSFPLLLRIPAWAEGATVTIDGRTEQVRETGSFLAIEREWQGETAIHLSLPMTAERLPRPNGAISIRRGPLLYALGIGEQWQPVNEDKPHREPPHSDWEVLPTTPWNYALKLSDGIRFEERELQTPVFSPKNAPVTATVKGQRLPDTSHKLTKNQAHPKYPLRLHESPNRRVPCLGEQRGSLTKRRR